MSREEAKGVAKDTARALAEAHGHMLASELIEYARARNPGVELRFAGASPVHLEIKTERGTISEARGPHEGWYQTFQRLGLL